MMPENGTSGCSAAWLARLTGGQKVVSSTLIIPTIFFLETPFSHIAKMVFFVFYDTDRGKNVEKLYPERRRAIPGSSLKLLPEWCCSEGRAVSGAFRSRMW